MSNGSHGSDMPWIIIINIPDKKEIIDMNELWIANICVKPGIGI